MFSCLTKLNGQTPPLPLPVADPHFFKTLLYSFPTHLFATDFDPNMDKFGLSGRKWWGRKTGVFKVPLNYTQHCLKVSI